MAFKLIVYGIWFATIYILLSILGDALLPGSLKSTAFTDLGILSFFTVFILDSLFTLGSTKS